MMPDQISLRSTVISTMLDIGELTRDEARAMEANPSADFDLARVNFDSLIVLDFCMKIEEASGVVVDPADIIGMKSINDLAALLVKRAA
jgi:acyl carrier protein